MLNKLFRSKLFFQTAIASMVAVFATIGIVAATTTIGSNISTAGTLTITGTTATSTFSTGGLTVGTNQFVVQQTSGYVGIGTTNPLYKLDVYPTTGFTGDLFRVASSTGTAGNGLVVTTNGYVGIGTTNPFGPLHIAQNDANRFYLQRNSNDKYSASIFSLKGRGTVASPVIAQQNDYALNIVGEVYDGNSYGSVAEIQFLVDGTPGLSNTPGRLSFMTTSSGAASAVERMRITSTGFVGIGGLVPPSLLSIGGNRSASSWTTTGLNFSVAANTITDTSSNRTTIATRASNSFDIPTFAFSNATSTITNAATLYIAGAPLANASSSIIINPLALDVAGGVSYFGGKVGIGTSSPASLLHVSAGTNATTTVEFGAQSVTSKTCFNVRDALGAATSFYFVGTTMVVEPNRCR